MECPSCRHMNSAMAARCEQCGATLVHEAVGHSRAYRQAVRNVNTRMFVGVGGGIGFALIATVGTAINPRGMDDEFVRGAALVGAAVGALLGRYIAWKESRRP